MDIYFDSRYGKLYEKLDKGCCETFTFRYGSQKVFNMFIKRSVPWLVDGRQYYDITTPYGYGGPEVEDVSVPTVGMVSAYKEAFAEYCCNNDIIAEFVRFHPLVGNAEQFREAYIVEFNRHTLAIDLKSDPFNDQFTVKCRNMVRKAVKRGVSIKIDHHCDKIEDFFRLYTLTMDKNKASDYYYFPLSYFHELVSSLQGNVLLIEAFYENLLVSAAIFLLSGKYLHYHLSATDPNHYELAANNLVLNEAVKFGQANGLEQLHLGGGASSSVDDSLFRFKRSFAGTEGNLRKFHIGKKIYNKTIYDHLVRVADKDLSEKPGVGFFPLYRL